MNLRSIAGAATLLLALGSIANAQQIPLVIDNIDLEGVELVDDVLTAASGTVSGTLAGLPFTTDITNFELDLAPDEAPGCAILNLELAPINLALLGLHVDTSAICLSITAIPGGGLLGDLLCGLTGLGLDEILDGLLGGPILGGDTLLGTILNQGLSNVQPAQGGGGESVCTGQCEVLELVLGPVDLTLLGLNVFLDDCEGGPVQVCVSATRREGLLGSLLCSLAGPRLLGLDLGDITQLVDLAQELLEDGVLSNADIRQLRELFRQLIRI